MYQLTSYTGSDLNFRGNPKKETSEMLRREPWTMTWVSHLDATLFPACPQTTLTTRLPDVPALLREDGNAWPSNLAAESPLHVPAKGSDEFAISMSAIAGQEFLPRRYSPSVLKLHVSGKRLVVNGSGLQPLNARLLLHLLHEQSAASRNCGWLTVWLLWWFHFFHSYLTY